MSDNKAPVSKKALEMIMRDVMDGMQDFAMLTNHQPRQAGTFHILSIERPEQSPLRADRASVSHMNTTAEPDESADIISFIEERERLQKVKYSA
jgi:hypothetical protein